MTLSSCVAAQKLDPQEAAYLPAPKNVPGSQGEEEGILSVKLHHSEDAEVPSKYPWKHFCSRLVQSNEDNVVNCYSKLNVW